MAKKESLKRKAVKPTAQQQKQHDYALEAVTEKGQVIGFAYRRKPLFETMYARGEINKEELQALRFYRERYEQSNHSTVKSCLAPKYGSGTPQSIIPLPSSSSCEVDFMEAAAGLWAVVLRQVAVEDMSFNRIAMNRYGSEEVPTSNPKRNRLRPKKKSHARRVRSEFFTALGLFVPAAQSLYSVNLDVDLLAHAKHLSAIPGNAHRKDARRGQHGAQA